MFLLPIYQAAAAQYGVPWQVLAAINEVETDYGNDLAVSTAGAVGWMQFMPATWLEYGVDVQDAGYADPYNPVDAIFAAARYLRAAGASEDLEGAIFAYNHSQAYVDSVMLRAKLIARYPANVIATLTGLAQGRLPVRGALATGESQLPPSPSRNAPAGGAEGSSAGSSPSGSPSPRSSQPGSTPAPPPTDTHAAAPTGGLRLVNLVAPNGRPVRAVADGKVVALGVSKRLGRYLVLRDVFGDTFTYADLGRLAHSYLVPKPTRQSPSGVVLAGAQAAHDSTPSQAASAGHQPLTLHVGGERGARGGSGASAPRSPSARRDRRIAGSTPDQAVIPVGPQRSRADGSSPTSAGEAGKVRIFAHPHNPYAAAALARSRRAAAAASRRRPLRKGAVVTAGTVLGSASSLPSAHRVQLRFAISPSGDRGSVAAQPVLQSWRQLDAALHPHGAKRAAGLLGATAGDAFLLSKAELQRDVLADPSITLPGCVRADVAIGGVSVPVLATLVFLSRSGLHPQAASLPCLRRVKDGYSAPGQPVKGPERDIALAKVNGIAIAHHQGPGSIADLTIRTLLTLQQPYAPAKIGSLMKYPGSRSTLASRQDARRIQIVFAPNEGQVQPSAAASRKRPAGAGWRLGGGASLTPAAAGAQPALTARQILSGSISAGQWTQLMQRVGDLPQPQVSRQRSPAAIPDPTASKPSKGR